MHLIEGSYWILQRINMVLAKHACIFALSRGILVNSQPFSRGQQIGTSLEALGMLQQYFFPTDTGLTDTKLMIIATPIHSRWSVTRLAMHTPCPLPRMKSRNQPGIALARWYIKQRLVIPALQLHLHATEFVDNSVIIFGISTYLWLKTDQSLSTKSLLQCLSVQTSSMEQWVQVIPRLRVKCNALTKPL